MTSARSFLPAAAALAVLGGGPAPALAADAAAILKKVDATMNHAADQTADLVMRVIEPDGTVRTRKFTAWQKGSDRRLVRFSAPADVKGTAVLVESRDSMYVYLPAFKRVRRIAGHTRSQSFLGSDFSYEDMGSVSYPELYDAASAGEDAGHFVLALTPRKDADISYGRLKMWVDKKMHHYTSIEFFDKSGKHVKTLTQSDFTNFEKDGTWYPRRLVMVDHRRNDHRTELDLTVTASNSGLDDRLFSPRSLSR